MWWRCFNINAVDESQILWSLVVTIHKLFIWVVFFISSIFSSLTDIDMSLIFFIDQLWLLERVLSCKWKLCTTTFLITQRFNIIWTALNWDLLTLLTSIQTQNRIKRFVVDIMYRWILLSVNSDIFITLFFSLKIHVCMNRTNETQIFTVFQFSVTCLNRTYEIQLKLLLISWILLYQHSIICYFNLVLFIWSYIVFDLNNI